MLLYTSTKSKVKPKLKPKAEREAYQAWCDKHGIGKKQKTHPTAIISLPIVSKPMIRETVKGKSLNTFSTGIAALPSKKVYTGEKIIGISAMHKSNLVPVFSGEQAVDISHMRR